MPQWLENLVAQVQSLEWWGVLLVYLGAAFLIQLVVTRFILFLTRKTKTSLDDHAVQTLRRPIFFTVLFVGIVYAMTRAEVAPRTLTVVQRILVSAGVLLWTKALMRISDAILEALARRVDDFEWIEPRSLPLYEIASKLAIIGSSVYALMLTWDIDVTAWLASAGVIGLAVGFAAKDTLANLFAGMFILADAPYKLGDFIVLGSGERGMVTDIGIRSTRILTRDDIEITLPNGLMANSKIINESSGPHIKRRLRIDVGVAYGSDVDQVREVLLDVAEKSEILTDHPKPSVRLRAFGDSALAFQLRGWIEKPVLRGRAQDQLNTAIYKRFNEEGIAIPFPQRDVHLHNAV